ncbi:MAG: nuclear transport factor 2 family protein [Bryobacteraceae bacterium]
MRALLLLAVAVCLSAKTPEQEIRETLARQQQDWNRGDVEAFMAAYDNSPATTFLGASLTRGYGPVLENYRKRYPKRENMGTLTFSELEFRVLGAESVLVLGRYHLARSASAGGEASGRFTLVFKRAANGWKIIHDHTSAGAR